jgi:hypothetical protein
MCLGLGGIASRYGLDCPRIESLWGRDFPHPSFSALEPTNFLHNKKRVSFQGLRRMGPGFEQLPYLAPRLKKEVSYTSTLLWVLIVCSGMNLTYCLITFYMKTVDKKEIVK